MPALSYGLRRASDVQFQGNITLATVINDRVQADGTLGCTSSVMSATQSTVILM